MNEEKKEIMFYNLGSQKIDFSKVQNFFNIDTSKPVIASKGFNKALKSVIDKDIDFLNNSLKKIVNKINKILVSTDIDLRIESFYNTDNIVALKSKLKACINEMAKYKLKNKVGIFTSEKKSKKERLKKLDESIISLNKLENELIMIENEYNKLAERKSKLGFVEVESDENKTDCEDPLERTINFYMNKN